MLLGKNALSSSKVQNEKRVQKKDSIFQTKNASPNSFVLKEKNTLVNK